MKKKLYLLLFLLILCMSGCSNSYAKEEYYSEEKLVAQGDRYSKKGSVFKSIDGGYSFTVSGFDGRETLKIWNVKEAQDLELNVFFSLSSGHGKLICVDENESITTLLEYTSRQEQTDEALSLTVPLSSGKNRLKFVGYDCKDVDITILLEEPEK